MMVFCLGLASQKAEISAAVTYALVNSEYLLSAIVQKATEMIQEVLLDDMDEERIVFGLQLLKLTFHSSSIDGVLTLRKVHMFGEDQEYSAYTTLIKTAVK